MMKVGLEKEYFVLDEAGQPILVVGDIPFDNCGWLAEARGEPFNKIIDAVFSLKASAFRIEKVVEKYNFKKEPAQLIHLSDAPMMKVSKEIRTTARKKYIKGLIKYKNIYGYTDHKISGLEATAGVHITFSQIGVATIKDQVFKYNTMFDFLDIFMQLDKAFADEISAAKRRPGFYEMKDDGRVEYRSLPSNVNLDKVIQVISDMNMKLGL